jgi:hypothetical protein
MADVYHHITIKSINKYPFTWLHICGQTKISRAKSVASCFGTKEDQIKSIMGFRQFLLRGIDKVQGEWNLVTLAWNMKRMYALAAA